MGIGEQRGIVDDDDRVDLRQAIDRSEDLVEMLLVLGDEDLRTASRIWYSTSAADAVG